MGEVPVSVQKSKTKARIVKLRRYLPAEVWEIGRELDYIRDHMTEKGAWTYYCKDCGIHRQTAERWIFIGRLEKKELTALTRKHKTIEGIIRALTKPVKEASDLTDEDEEPLRPNPDAKPAAGDDDGDPGETKLVKKVTVKDLQNKLDWSKRREAAQKERIDQLEAQAKAYAEALKADRSGWRQMSDREFKELQQLRELRRNLDYNTREWMEKLNAAEKREAEQEGEHMMLRDKVAEAEAECERLRERIAKITEGITKGVAVDDLLKMELGARDVEINHLRNSIKKLEGTQ